MRLTDYDYFIAMGVLFIASIVYEISYRMGMTTVEHHLHRRLITQSRYVLRLGTYSEFGSRWKRFNHMFIDVLE